MPLVAFSCSLMNLSHFVPFSLNLLQASIKMHTYIITLTIEIWGLLQYKEYMFFSHFLNQIVYLLLISSTKKDRFGIFSNHENTGEELH